MKKRRNPKFVDGNRIKVTVVLRLDRDEAIEYLADHLHKFGIAFAPNSKVAIYNILQTQVQDATEIEYDHDDYVVAEYLIGKYFPEIKP